MDTEPTGAAPSRARRIASGVVDELLLLTIAGIATGVVVIGIGSRLVMLTLRLTSDSRVIGVQSDDDFTIGRLTLAGTYNLLLIGAAAGLIGAAAYQWVRPWLIGPQWFRYVTVGLASGAVVGSMLIHADGIDFRALTPTWLAIGLFVALPAAFGAAVAWTVDRLDRPGSFVHRGRARWFVAGACVVPFLPTLFILAIAIPFLVVWIGMRDRRPEGEPAPTPLALVLVARVAWLGIAVVGLVALIDDIRDIASVT